MLQLCLGINRLNEKHLLRKVVLNGSLLEFFGMLCHTDSSINLKNCMIVIFQVAYLSGSDEEIIESAFNFGKNMGIAFQLVDDLLDYVASADSMGKPTAADLRLGLATAPVLFACEKVGWFCERG